MTELQLQIADVRRWLDAIDAAADRGQLPEMSDARLVAKHAAALESMIWHAHIRSIREAPERTPEEDRAAQRFIGGGK